MDRITGHIVPEDFYRSISRCERCGRRMDVLEVREIGLVFWICSGRKPPKIIPKRWKSCSFSPHQERLSDYEAYLRGESRPQPTTRKESERGTRTQEPAAGAERKPPEIESWEDVSPPF